MKYIFLFLSFLTACGLPSRDMTDFNRVGQTIKQRLKQENQLSFFAFGYLGPGKFKGLDISLDSDISADIPEARRQMVEVVQKIVETVNQDVKFLTDLEEVPFEPRHILMSLYFNGKDSELVKANFAHARIIYYKDGPVGMLPIRVYEETLDEALVELKKEK